MVIVQFCGRLVDNIGLVPLILLDWELHLSYSTVLLCTRNPDLVSFAIPIFHILV